MMFNQATAKIFVLFQQLKILPGRSRAPIENLQLKNKKVFRCL